MKHFIQKNKWYIFLYFYHLIFVFVAYYYRVNRGSSDAHTYWGKYLDINKYSWTNFINYGSDVLLLINYPFIRLGLPFIAGFIIYGTIGYFGILTWIKWTEKVIPSFYLFNINLLYLIFLFPNFHYATAALGKEPIVFWGIASIFYAFVSKKYFSFSFLLGALAVLIIRPHVALMLGFSFLVIFIFNPNYSLKKRLIVLFGSSIFFAILLYMVFQISQIYYWKWSRIQYYNDYSILSFQNSGSYVPMLEYNYVNKFFAFLYRPLFIDSHNIWLLFSSFENLFFLLLSSVTVVFAIKNFKKIQYPLVIKVVFLYTIVSCLLYVQRYANLGIFMRTKVMFQPFLVIAMVFILQQSVLLQSNKENNGES